MSEDDMVAVRQLRETVFVQEQNVPAEIEWDGKDDDARHLLAWAGEHAVGTLRWRRVGSAGKVERVCVDAAMRGQAVGAILMKRVIDDIRALDGLNSVKLSAQVSVIGFYERLGFTAHGAIYDDAGIPHRDMTLRLTDGPA